MRTRFPKSRPYIQAVIPLYHCESLGRIASYIQSIPKKTLPSAFCNVYTLRIYTGGCGMGTARVFRSGNSQAVRLPKEFRLKSQEVEIFRRGDEIVLREKEGDMARAFDLLAGLSDDIDLRDRNKDRPQKRKGL